MRNSEIIMFLCNKERARLFYSWHGAKPLFCFILVTHYFILVAYDQYLFAFYDQWQTLIPIFNAYENVLGEFDCYFNQYYLLSNTWPSYQVDYKHAWAP